MKLYQEFDKIKNNVRPLRCATTLAEKFLPFDRNACEIESHLLLEMRRNQQDIFAVIWHRQVKDKLYPCKIEIVDQMNSWNLSIVLQGDNPSPKRQVCTISSMPATATNIQRWKKRYGFN
jgi:hypothetical protein